MIRKMKLIDRDEYLKMTHDFYQSDAVLEPQRIPIENTIQTFGAIISNSPYVDAYVYEGDTDLAGYVLLSFTYSNEFGGIILLLEELYIKEAYQGLGYGQALLDFVENKYRDEVIGIKLEVVKSNDIAIQLYDKKGYDKVKYVSMFKKIEE